MQLIVAAVGSRMPAWVDTAFADYAGRMPVDLKIMLKEVRPEPRSGGKTVPAMLAAEAERLRAILPRPAARSATMIALDEHGRESTSTELAATIGRWRSDGSDVVFLIGGPDGLDPTLKAEAQTRLKLSAFTLPHGMVRVLLAEQLYRAWSITQNHPYHRA